MTVRQLEKLNIFLILFFGISLFVYFLFNGGAYTSQLRYALFLNSPFASDDLKEGEIIAVQAATAKLQDGKFALYIPKIDVQTPVIVPKSTDKVGVLAALEEGVGVFPGSVEPGETGRTILLGHSSRASWYRGNYAYIFSLLPKLNEGDEFYLMNGEKKLRYQVFARKVLPPTETNRLFETKVQDGSELDLVTCYPIGSASNRNIVQAKLVAVEEI